jgi:phospholipid/cholesterol/gamma-HCH transport system ATP-binding protein
MGQEVTHFDERQWYDVRSRIGVLFQEGGLFDSLTIEENVAYPLLNQARFMTAGKKPTLDSVRPDVQEALNFVELGNTLNKFPSELSGGMRRRVGIARGSVADPDLFSRSNPRPGSIRSLPTRSSPFLSKTAKCAIRRRPSSPTASRTGI